MTTPTYASWFRIMVSGRNYAATYPAPVSSTDSALAITDLFRGHGVVELDPNGVYFGADTLFVPPGRALHANGATFQLRTSATTNTTVRNGGVVEDLTLDGNMAARVAAGYASFCHGGYVINVSKAGFRRCRAQDCGDAIANGYAGLSAVGFYLERNTDAVRDMVAPFIQQCVIDDSAHILPFGTRAKTTFDGYAEGDIPYKMLGAIVTENDVTGTFKNGHETVGPDNQGAQVTDNIFRSPSGQGAAEADFGAHDGLYARNQLIGAGIAGVMQKSMSAFNSRTSDNGDGKLKRSRNNTFEENEVRDVVTAGTYSVYLGEDAGSTGTRRTGEKISNCSIGPGGTGRIVAHSMDSSVFAIEDMVCTDIDATGVTHAVQLYGSHGASDVHYVATPGGPGARMLASARGLWNSSSSPTADITIGAGVELTGDIVLDPKGPCAVDGATLSGSTITLPSTASDLSIVNSDLTLTVAGMADLLAALPAIGQPAANNTLHTV